MYVANSKPRRQAVSVTFEKLPLVTSLYFYYFTPFWLGQTFVFDRCLLRSIIANLCPNIWPCITKPTKSLIAQFGAMAKNRWPGSASMDDIGGQINFDTKCLPYTTYQHSTVCSMVSAGLCLLFPWRSQSLWVLVMSWVSCLGKVGSLAWGRDVLCS